MAPRQDLELAGLQFEGDGSRHPRLLARNRPKFFRQAPDHRSEFV